MLIRSFQGGLRGRVFHWVQSVLSFIDFTESVLECFSFREGVLRDQAIFGGKVEVILECVASETVVLILPELSRACFCIQLPLSSKLPRLLEPIDLNLRTTPTNLFKL